MEPPLLLGRGPGGAGELRARFERLWRASTPLTKVWVDDYRRRAPVPTPPTPEPREPPPEPTSIQREALERLAATRREGRRAGLVVLATGLGKTYLSAFDFRQLGGRRALFVAHRDEILSQARAAWVKVFPDRLAGRIGAGTHDVDADLLFASIQTLSRAEHLRRFAPDHFDYVVVDEFHHAAAESYRRLLTHFRPRFLLGLTATPDRLDGASLLELCDGNLVVERNLLAGIQSGLLVPFRYFGVKDGLDFQPIPWRSGRFDERVLTRALETEARADEALRALQRHAPEARRVMVFCATQSHADFMARRFADRGWRAAAVHSGPGSAPRMDSVRKLGEGELQVLTTVDVFNEGLDVPAIDTVLLLRPTTSPVIFLQQVGRGLRRSSGKDLLTVIDFIGNHRAFLTRPQGLVYLTGGEAAGGEAVQRVLKGLLDLPAGCSVEIETEAIEFLRSLSHRSASDTLVAAYRRFHEERGRRPRATELLRELGTFHAVRSRHRSYFDLVAEMESGERARPESARLDLVDWSERHAQVHERHRAWFQDLLRTPMTQAYKMLALQAMLDADALPGEMSVEENARRADEIVRGDVRFRRELTGPDRGAFGPAFVREWRRMPLGVWAEGQGTSRPWFELDGAAFRCLLEEPERELLADMTAEVVELRLAEYLARSSPMAPAGEAWLLRVAHSRGRPILRFDRRRQPGIPEGEVEVWVGGEPYRFRFQKIAVNHVARPHGATNELPRLLRGWFGPSAGQPGTNHVVLLDRSGDRLRLASPALSEESREVSSPAVPFFDELEVACGALRSAGGLSPSGARPVRLDHDDDLDPRRHFVVRASGDSMNGGPSPIRDGDWVLCEWSAARSADEVEGRPALVVGVEGGKQIFAAMKVPRRRGAGWVLEGSNPRTSVELIPPGVRVEPVAIVLRVVRART